MVLLLLVQSFFELYPFKVNGKLTKGFSKSWLHTQFEVRRTDLIEFEVV